jgi:methylthioribose-1-phosphate isomerase
MKAKLFLAAAIMFGLGIGSASAQIRKTAVSQHKRIKQGVRSGELTRPEAVNLARDQREIRQDIREAKTNDGVITPGERQEIRQDQRQASREIYRKKHNRRDRN